MTTYNVTTSTFSSTLTSAVNGDILVLADGNYGSLTRRRDWGHHENAVTIRAANKFGAVFSTTYIAVNNLTFDGLVLAGATTFTAVSDTIVTNCKIGYTAIRSACDNILFKYNWNVGFSQIQSTGSATASSNIVWDCCCFKYELSMYTGTPTSGFGDWLQMQNPVDCAVRKCTFWDNYAYWDGTPGTNIHLDQLQYYSNGAVPLRVTVEDNWFWDTTATHANSADGCQGLNTGGIEQIVRGNIIASTHPNTLIVHSTAIGAAQSVYEENLILAGPTVPPYNTGYFAGGNINMVSSSPAPALVRNTLCYSYANNGGTHDVSNITTGISGPAHFDWTNAGRDISNYVPNPGGPADVNQRWRTRLDAIIAGTQDFYDPNGYTGDPVLYLADAEPSAPSIPGTPTINGTLNVGQTITFTASGPVTGSPTPTRTWEVYNTVSGLVQDSPNAFYLLDASDEGDGIYVIQREENTEGSDTAQSATTSAIGAALSAPVVSAFYPANNATGVAINTTFTVTFDQDIQFGTGNIELWRAGAPRETWSVTSDVGTGPHTVSISGAVLTIDTQNDMFEADYHIRIDAGAIESLSGAVFAGISDETTWNFSTIPTPTAGRVVFRSGGIVVSSTGLPLLTS